jgi:hypothetical protein
VQETQRWVNQSQPQTLVIATWLLYVNAVFSVLDVLRGGNVLRAGLLVTLYYAIRIGGGVMGGYGIANEKKWGYYLGIAAAVAPFVLRLLVFGNPFVGDLIGMAFEIALVALLLHPMSRSYEKVWFK